MYPVIKFLQQHFKTRAFYFLDLFYSWGNMLTEVAFSHLAGKQARQEIDLPRKTVGPVLQALHSLDVFSQEAKRLHT